MTLHTPTAASKRLPVRRCLFGRPDPVETQAWLTSQLDEIRREKEAKWAFDFEHEVSLPTASTSDYEFIPVESMSVPSFYRLKVIMPTAKRLPNSTGTSPAESEDSDCSFMDTSDDSSMIASPSPTKRGHNTPKRPRKLDSRAQRKLTNYMHPKKRLSHSSKKSDRSVPDSSPASSSSVRSN
ncbi:unnamed protein product, partial [Mesorhabditis spiculigera]